MPEAIALFARAPIPGRAKTRLCPPLSAAESAELQQAFVEDMWRRLQGVPGAALFLYSDVAWQPYTELAGPARTALQQGADLGARMLHCFEELNRGGYERALIVGSDSPTVPAKYLRQGLDALAHTDAVLGPVEDGGYYAVGCRRPRSQMFEGVTWSVPTTLEEPERAFQRAGLSLQELPTWYDVDTVDDLRRLATDSQIPDSTRAWFARHPKLAAQLGVPRKPQT